MLFRSLLDAAVVPDDGVARVLRDARYRRQVRLFPRAQFRYLGLNARRYPPFADRRVRAAVAAAVDPATVAKALYAGAAVPLAGFTVPGVAGHVPGRSVPAIDEAAVRRDLATAGHAGGEGFPPLEIVGIEPHRNDLVHFADRIGRVLGTPVGVRIMERNAYLTAAASGDLPLFLGGWTADYPDALGILAPLWRSDSPFNASRYANPAVDALLDEARTTLSPERRADLYAATDAALAADVAGVPLYAPAYVLLVKDGTPSVCLTPAGALCFDRARAAALPD